MLVRTSKNLLVVVCLALPLAVSSIGCGGAGTEPKHTVIKPGDMPEGGDWPGVYFSPFYGYLHIVKEGDNINGAWRTASGEKWGEISGSVTGNVARFEWTEHTIGLVGPSATRTGKGYFKYVIPKEGEAHEIHGEIGQGADETGDPWKGVKQFNMQPNPASVKPDEVEGRGTGGGWDDSGGEKKEGGEGEGGEGEGEGGGGGGE